MSCGTSFFGDCTNCGGGGGGPPPSLFKSLLCGAGYANYGTVTPCTPADISALVTLAQSNLAAANWSVIGFAQAMQDDEVLQCFPGYGPPPVNSGYYHIGTAGLTDIISGQTCPGVNTSAVAWQGSALQVTGPCGQFCVEFANLPCSTGGPPPPPTFDYASYGPLASGDTLVITVTSGGVRYINGYTMGACPP